MSENTQAQSSEESVVQPNVASQEETTEKEWTYEQLAQRLSKANAEAKAERQKTQALKKQMEEVSRTKLAEQGQYKELMGLYQKEAEDAKSHAAKLKDAFAMKIVTDSVAMEAQKLGCVDAEALSSLINLSELPIDDNFNVDRNHVRTMLEDVKKKKPYFFKSEAPRVIDAIPAKVDAPKVKSVSDMESKDIEKILLTKFGKK